MEIRSFRAVFDLERRIYRVDRLRLNPAGVPVRGVVYFLALTAVVIAAGRAPLISLAFGALPWYLAYVALPALSSAVLTIIRIDGRPFHQAARSLLRHLLGAGQPTGLRARRGGSRPSGDAPGAIWWPEPVLLMPDGSDATMRRLSYTGPGAVLVTVPHGLLPRPRGLARLGRAGLLMAITRSDVRLSEARARPEDREGARRDTGADGAGAVVALAPGKRLRVG